MIFFNIILLVCVFFLLKALNRYKQVFRQENLWGKWPVPKVSLQSFNALFTPDELGPKKDTEITFIGNYGSHGSTSDLETWVLCTVAKTADSIFEFGTFTGKTTYLLAKNSPKNAKIFTLTLPPEAHNHYTSSDTDDKKDKQ